jgi:hypothetical protein
MNWAFTAALAVSWGEVIKLGLIGSGLVAAMAGLPVAAAMMARSYPQEARHAMRAWLVVLAVVSVSAAVFSLRLERPSEKVHSVRLRPAPPPATPRVRSRFMTAVIWRDTAGCTLQHTLYHEMVCDEYRAEMAAAGLDPADRLLMVEKQPADWSPAALLGITSLTDGPTRRVLVLLLTLIATGGAGLIGRWAVLATAESYRLGEGQASGMPANALAAMVPIDAQAGAGLTPLEIFSMWFNGRIRQEPSGKLPANGAYEDYRDTCALNGFPDLSARKFGELLTAKAENSGGRIGKVKSGGIHYYTGLAFAGERGSLETVSDGVDPLTALPRRSGR